MNVVRKGPVVRVGDGFCVSIDQVDEGVWVPEAEPESDIGGTGGLDFANSVAEVIAEFAGELWVSVPLEQKDVEAAGIECAADPVGLLCGVGHPTGGLGALDEFCNFIAEYVFGVCDGCRFEGAEQDL